MTQIHYWLQVICPDCSISNWINTGNPYDCTTLDVNAIECWNCKSKFWLDEETARDVHWSDLEGSDDELPKTLEEVLNDSYTEKGLSTPLK